MGRGIWGGLPGEWAQVGGDWVPFCMTNERNGLKIDETGWGGAGVSGVSDRVESGSGTDGDGIWNGFRTDSATSSEQLTKEQLAGNWRVGGAGMARNGRVGGALVADPLVEKLCAWQDGHHVGEYICRTIRRHGPIAHRRRELGPKKAFSLVCTILISSTLFRFVPRQNNHPTNLIFSPCFRTLPLHQPLY